MKERVFHIVSDIMNWPLKKINENSSPESIETWDSLNHMNLILSLEEEFRVKFTDEQIVEVMDVQTIIKILEKSANL